MTGTNHAITGGVIGLAIGGPLAIPVAFVSHFAMDWLPHFGLDTDDRLLRKKYFMWSVALDITLLPILFSFALVYGLQWYVIASMFIAMTPDFSWVYKYVVEEKMGKLEPKRKNKFDQWHTDIQKRETPKGAWVEIAWFILMLFIAARLI